jgi:hypothetical protein
MTALATYSEGKESRSLYHLAAITMIYVVRSFTTIIVTLGTIWRKGVIMEKKAQRMHRIL